MNNMTENTNTPQLTSDNLKVLKDQLEYEALMNKKARQYGQYCTDTQLKDVCNQAADIHKQNFNELKNYLDSHQ
ncbi:hypothetical protein [Garciella nitratireducens]